MEVLWPRTEPGAAARNLRYSLYTARKLLTDPDVDMPLLQRNRDLITLGPPDLIWTDVNEFTVIAAATWRSTDPSLHERAISIYTGDLLPDDLYEDWVTGHRASLRASHLAVLTRLAELYCNRLEFDLTIVTLQRLLELEPSDEAAHVQLMRLHARNGRRLQALAQFDELRAVLERELDATPETGTCELAEAIRRGDPIDAIQPIVHVNLTRTDNASQIDQRLPAPLDRLIGREQEIAELRRLLGENRLLTLVGTGGIGKTRLAIALAHSVSDSFPNGVVFVSLAPITDARHVIPAIAQELGVRESGRTSLIDRVIAELRERRMLMVLDNVEQVAKEGPRLTEILAAAPGVRMVLTSRSRLHLRGEQEYPVSPLRYPSPDAKTPWESLSSYPAVSLFVQRTSEIHPRFRMTETNVNAIAEISQRLAGIPLAIELAAGRSAVLTPQEILARLDHPLAVLSRGQRDAPERHQTLESAIRWSYQLLRPSEQRLFQCLSVFAGGWNLEAAKFVDEPNNDADPETSPIHPSLLDDMTALFDASLIVSGEVNSASERRFHMLEPIRAFAAQLLDESGESDPVHQGHAQYFAELAEQTGSRLEGPLAEAWLRRLVTEQDNLRTALRWCIDAGKADIGLRIASSLWEFWGVHGNVSEGRRWLDALLAISDGAATPAWAEARRGAA
ncbi:MAG: BTAD domain-containing putative transcriptional regulator, partial [Nitrolancea sp.]